jgi:Arc/MetJ family transcription regulator
MLCLMRTTVTIDDELLARAKVAAARSHRTLGSVVEDALRALLSSQDAATRRESVPLPTDGGSGTLPGVDLDDRATLADLLDDGSPRAAV